MSGDQRRYFIELQPEDGTPVPRFLEAEKRRAQALSFITAMNAWLKINHLDTKVSAVAVTALGQVQITCEGDVISRIRDEDVLNIAAIRPGAMYVEGMDRWAEAGRAATETRR